MQMHKKIASELLQQVEYLHLYMITSVAIVGAGTMGSGIALSAALGGCKVLLCDINAATLLTAQKNIGQWLQGMEAKQKIGPGEADVLLERITFTGNIDSCKAALLIEAIVEKLEVKQDLFARLAAINDAGSILASNTSSLSITAIQQRVPNAGRVAGLHFFNPAHMMKLVEVVQGLHSSAETIATLMQFCKQINKVPVLCKDVPGFIVNRVARPYYLEALHLASQQNVSFETIDAAMEAAGFKMGPFKLMDLIGMDINLAVSTSLYQALNHPARLKPSALQIQKVEAGKLGRKTGEGFYPYPST